MVEWGGYAPYRCFYAENSEPIILRNMYMLLIARIMKTSDFLISSSYINGEGNWIIYRLADAYFDESRSFS